MPPKHGPRHVYMKKYRAEHPEYVQRGQAKVAAYKKARPWYGSWSTAKTRCTNPNVNCYHRYGKRGIKFLLTLIDMEKLWKRDKAHLLKLPCIDRIDNDGHYEYSNCRFVERSVNSTKGNYEARWKR